MIVLLYCNSNEWTLSTCQRLAIWDSGRAVTVLKEKWLSGELAQS
jgi:hypothetical protein